MLNVYNIQRQTIHPGTTEILSPVVLTDHTVRVVVRLDRNASDLNDPALFSDSLTLRLERSVDGQEWVHAGGAEFAGGIAVVDGVEQVISTYIADIHRDGWRYRVLVESVEEQDISGAVVFDVAEGPRPKFEKNNSVGYVGIETAIASNSVTSATSATLTVTGDNTAVGVFGAARGTAIGAPAALNLVYDGSINDNKIDEDFLDSQTSMRAATAYQVTAQSETVVATTGAEQAAAIYVVAVAADNVNQTTPIGATSYMDVDVAVDNTLSADLPAAAGSLVLGFALGHDYSFSKGQPLAVVGNGTLRDSGDVSQNGTNAYAATSEVSAGGDVTVGFRQNTGYTGYAIDHLAVGAFVFLEVDGGAPEPDEHDIAGSFSLAPLTITGTIEHSEVDQHDIAGSFSLAPLSITGTVTQTDIQKTLRVRTKTGWITKPSADTPENALDAENVDDNFLALEKQIEDLESRVEALETP